MADFFDSLFDFNGDGKTDGFEDIMAVGAFVNYIKNEENAEQEDEDEYEDEDEDEDEDDEYFELKAAGLDIEDLELMDKEEREEALEDAGLDPDDFDL